MNENDLKERAEKQYDSLKKRRRELYKLARDLGFSSGESQVLSGTSEDNINKIYKERESKNV